MLAAASLTAVSGARAPDPDAAGAGFASRRVVFAGSGPMTIEFGDTGIQLRFPNRFLRIHWSAFDAAALMARDLNGGDLPIISKAQAGETPLTQLLGTEPGDPALTDLIERSSAWAQSHTQLRLPLKIDAGFAVRRGKKGDEPLAPIGLQREFILIDKRFFETPHERGLPWPRVVAACAYMIQLKDPDWVDAIETGPPASSADD